ncbi:hypothetical protein BGZ82_002449 [Podila clonocystis]|nr:hypothetical protein BGZ82_002449 [Podila clonocystis]
MPPPEFSNSHELLPGQELSISVPPIYKASDDLDTPYTLEEIEALSKPKVLISGGGIGGLTLAILLHKANIPFLVLERAKEIKPLGSSIGLGAPVAPLLIQLGIYDEFVRRGKYYNEVHMLKEDLTLVHTMDSTWLKSVPDLYDLLFNSIPRERILLGKRVLSFVQGSSGVMARCSDNTSYNGDILVGADGAYSAVRQQLFKDLKVDQMLPARDDVSLPFNCVCLVGQTEMLDPEEFPLLKEERSQVNSVLGVSTMCTWIAATTAQNTVCWMVIHFLDKESAKRNDSFRCSEWGPEAAEALAREVRPFKIPGGKDGKVLTLGEYIDKTPKHLMAKVMLEEIVFKTWYGGRTVLLGDATGKDITSVFKEYHEERYPVAKAAFKSSQLFIRNLGKNMLATVVRGTIKRLPRWLWTRIVTKMVAMRCQASFLPLVEDHAIVKPLHQRSLHKTLPILQKLAENPYIVASRSVPATV